MNIRHPVRIVSAVVMCVACHAATAGPETDFRLRADVLPASCDLTLLDNGVVDFGVIMASSLRATGFTRLSRKILNLRIVCDAATQVAISIADGRPGTVPAGIGRFLFPDQSDATTFGAGSVAGHNVAGYQVYRGLDGSGDGATAFVIASEDGGTTWARSSGDTDWLTPQRLHSWAKTSGGAPASYSTITQTYYVELAINQRSDLPALTHEIPIDGLATITIQYL